MPSTLPFLFHQHSQNTQDAAPVHLGPSYSFLCTNFLTLHYSLQKLQEFLPISIAETADFFFL